MKKKLLALYEKYGDLLRYLVIGGLTTVVDIVVFWLSHTVLGLHYQLGKVIAWVFAVAFAFWGNKVVVFRSKSAGGRDLLREAGSFVGSRVLTLLFSLAFMYVAVDLLSIDGNLANILVNVGVMILNYILSKLFVFRKKEDKDQQ